MAIALEFSSFIVRRALIVERYPGGWDQCLRDHHDVIGGRVYYDDHLFRDGAMGPDGIQDLLSAWSARGFTPAAMVDGREVSKDICVMDLFFGKTLPCDWVTRAPGNPFMAYMTGTEPGRVVGPESMRRVIAQRTVSNQLSRIGAAPE